MACAVRHDYREILTNPRVAAMLALGFASGLPLALSGGTLQAWLATADVDIKTIGVFSLVGLPYTIKFLWAPIMDRYVPPWFGRRRGWLLLTQFAVLTGLAFMATLSPGDAVMALGAAALWIAFFSASQDIVFDAYRTDVLRPPERGLGAAVSVLGYRVAMLVSGALALILADQVGWQLTYRLMAAVMALMMLVTLISPEPEGDNVGPRSLKEAVVAPLSEFLSRPGALALLALIVLYKFGDAFAGTLTTAFLIKGAGFTPTDVGAINKGMGVLATLAGALVGGSLMVRMGLVRALLLFGVLQAVTNLLFVGLAVTGKNYPLMVAAIAGENLAGGMGTVAFVALLMALCDHRYTATQYALFTAFASMARVFIGPPSGLVVDAVGWANFFSMTFLLAWPGIWLVWRMRAVVIRAEARPQAIPSRTASTVSTD